VAAYKVLIKPSAVKEIEEIPKKDRQRIVKRIQSLSKEPRPPGCEKLSGQEKYRVRQGRFRMVYSIADEDMAVLIVEVGHRKEIYR
jgi:mRNA interferase RelE/StbE